MNEGRKHGFFVRTEEQNLKAVAGYNWWKERSVSVPLAEKGRGVSLQKIPELRAGIDMVCDHFNSTDWEQRLGDLGRQRSKSICKCKRFKA